MKITDTNEAEAREKLFGYAWEMFKLNYKNVFYQEKKKPSMLIVCDQRQ